MNVFVLAHERELDGSDDVKTIGIYRTRADADEARTRAQRLPGFREFPDGFSIDEVELGRDQWTSGFGTVDAAGERIVPAGGTRAA